jgi:hypothetical protein
MITDLDIYRSAKLLIDRHGDEAPIHAAMRAGAPPRAGLFIGIKPRRETLLSKVQNGGRGES